MQKGIIHPSDPIIGILNLEGKRALALKKAQWGSCACFGPHHGTRCPCDSVGVPANLWDMYVASMRTVAGCMPGQADAGKERRRGRR